MRAPSDAQAALLALVAEHEGHGLAVEWRVGLDHVEHRRPSMARLYVEVVDRESNTSRFEMADRGRYAHRVVTVEACVRAEWLSTLHERTVSFPARRWTRAQDWQLRQLDMTEDGMIALGLWRERKLHAPPAPLPRMAEREREVAELAQRALELGYALCAREPARAEARRMRRAGWFKTCWVANHAAGLVPTSMAVVEIRPDLADTAPHGSPDA